MSDFFLIALKSLIQLCKKMYYKYNSLFSQPSKFCSKFGDIFDEEFFIYALRNHVKVVKQLPEDVLQRFDNNISNIVNLRVKAWSSPVYYRQKVLPKLLELGYTFLASILVGLFAILVVKTPCHKFFVYPFLKLLLFFIFFCVLLDMIPRGNWKLPFASSTNYHNCFVFISREHFLIVPHCKFSLLYKVWATSVFLSKVNNFMSSS